MDPGYEATASIGTGTPISLLPNSRSKRLAKSVLPVPGAPTNITCFEEMK